MKTLITLSALQTIGVIVLIVMLANAPTGQSQSSQATATGPTIERELVSGGRSQSFDETRLRQIIREELIAHQPNDGRNLDARKNDVLVEPRAAEKLRIQRDLVAQHIETYKGIGAINEAQMDELQAEIGELDEPNRKQMMSLLISALNAGSIKGHL